MLDLSSPKPAALYRTFLSPDYSHEETFLPRHIAAIWELDDPFRTVGPLSRVRAQILSNGCQVTHVELTTCARFYLPTVRLRTTGQNGYFSLRVESPVQ